MGLREDVLRRMDRKRLEIAELESKIGLAREYLQALEDMLKLIPKESGSGTAIATLRPGTALAKARDAIRKAGKPLHVTELLEAIGKESTRNAKAGLSGTLATYVRRGEIFTRPAPNTFGLIDMGPTAVPPDSDDDPFADMIAPAPPKGFGKL